MNKIRKILSVIPILSCICVLSLTTHAAENQNKNYLSDLRAYAGVESKENIIKDFKPDKLEYSIVVPNEKVSVGAKMSENVPENSKIVAYYTCHMFGYSWPDNVKLENSDSASTDISAMLSDETVEGSTVEIKSTVLSKVGSKAFTGIDKKAIIKVPAKQLKSYKKMMKNKGQKKTVKITK